jgi:hypothetical protein
MRAFIGDEVANPIGAGALALVLVSESM